MVDRRQSSRFQGSSAGALPRRAEGHRSRRSVGAGKQEGKQAGEDDGSHALKSQAGTREASSQHELIVGCDYSTKAIDLAFVRGNDWSHVKIRLDEKDVDRVTLSILHAELASQPIKAVYIEQPWMRGNPLTTMRLVAVAQSVGVIAKQLNYPVRWAHVARWRSAVFGKGRYSSADAKELSREWARTHTALEIKDDNIADAVCIARFGQMMEYEA